MDVTNILSVNFSVCLLKNKLVIEIIHNLIISI